MQKLRKWTLIASIITIGFSIIWFLLGTTANFQRGVDLVTTIKFAVIWLPSVILITLTGIVIKSRRRTSFSFLAWPLVIVYFFSRYTIIQISRSRGLVN